ncbi:MAG: ABC transporter permease [Methanosarcinaceae archaeon]|nr:ABC transporter permease [Methanosarcinaceae archaeon]
MRKSKKNSISNVFVIAQKEFADIITNPLFLMLIATYTLIILSFSYKGVIFGEDMGEQNILMFSFRSITRQVGWLGPLIGIVLGFDAVIRERKSGSLNVLLTHPVFRDNIITGKLLGITGTLFLVIMFSVTVSLGAILIASGVQVSEMELIRIATFAISIFFYVLIFSGIAVLVSIIANDAADSLIYNVIIWLATCIVSGAIIIAFAAIITGQSSPYELASELIKLSPLHYYSEAAAGRIDLSWGGINNEPVNAGIFDTRFTLTQWFSEFWTEITVLIVTPITLLIISFIAFMRKDITL